MEPARLQAAAAERTAQLVDAQPPSFDLMEKVARVVLVSVIAEAIGVAGDSIDLVVRTTRSL